MITKKGLQFATDINSKLVHTIFVLYNGILNRFVLDKFNCWTVVKMNIPRRQFVDHLSLYLSQKADRTRHGARYTLREAEKEA
jgi:hypothetical protein